MGAGKGRERRRGTAMLESTLGTAIPRHQDSYFQQTISGNSYRGLVAASSKAAFMIRPPIECATKTTFRPASSPT